MSTDGPSRSRSDAIAVAILLPPEIAERAVELSAALPAAESQGLTLGPDFLPHITLTQQFVAREAINDVRVHVDRVLRDVDPLALRVTGGGKGSNSVWMMIERSQAIVSVHERLLDATAAFDTDGDTSAFFDEDARDRDVRWVREFRQKSSIARFTPHITLGHASEPPFVEPIDFVATVIAVCRLGRFCSCRQILRATQLNRER